MHQGPYTVLFDGYMWLGDVDAARFHPHLSKVYAWTAACSWSV